MKKIVVDKSEAVADLVERILESPEEEVLVVVPKNSHLASSPNNFKLLAREAKFLQKKLVIESVDEDVLALAHLHGLTSNHPLFSSSEKHISDIVSRDDARRRPSPDKKAVSLRVEKEEEDESREEEEAGEPAEEEARPAVLDVDMDEEQYETLAPEEGKPLRKWLVAVIAILLLVALGTWGFTAALAKSDLTIRFKKAPWTASSRLSGATTEKSVDPASASIPVQLFAEEKTLTQSFPATGHASGQTKAKGTITVVNAYGPEPQALVAKTRFLTPDGKLFRLDNDIVVPGATMKDGKVATPGSIKAPVTADEAGPGSNVGKVDRLSIPGFEGSPKHDGFYGMLESGTSGGSSGAGLVATASEAAAAKGKAQEILKGAFRTSFLGSIPSDVKVLEDAATFQVLKVTVNPDADASGNFSVSASGLFQAFGFREKDVTALLNAQAAAASPGMKLQNLSVSYADPQPDYVRKTITLGVTANAVLVPAFESDAFAQKIAGRPEKEVREEVANLPELDNFDLKVFPGWLSHLPQNPGRIHIVVQ